MIGKACLKYLHQENVLIAVVPEHVVIHLGHDPVLVLAIEEPDVGRVYFVLVLNGSDEALHCGGHQVQRGVDILQNINRRWKYIICRKNMKGSLKYNITRMIKYKEEVKTHLCFLADIDHDSLRDWGHQPRPLGAVLCNSGDGQIMWGHQVLLSTTTKCSSDSFPCVHIALRRLKNDYNK